jgi:AraC-like DNA-binding protein
MISPNARARGVSRRRHTGVQMIGALKQLEQGWKVEDVAREVGCQRTHLCLRRRTRGMDARAQESKQLRDENTRLQELAADLSLH